MLVSELIAELSKLRLLYGDKPVVVQYPSGRGLGKFPQVYFSNEILPVVGSFEASVVIQVYSSVLPLQETKE